MGFNSGFKGLKQLWFHQGTRKDQNNTTNAILTYEMILREGCKSHIFFYLIVKPIYKKQIGLSKLNC